MQVNDPVSPDKCFRGGVLSVDAVGSGNFRQILVNFDFLSSKPQFRITLKYMFFMNILIFRRQKNAKSPMIWRFLTACFPYRLEN